MQKSYEVSRRDVTICDRCAVEFDADQLPDICPICADERQHLAADGSQTWTTLRESVIDREITLEELEPGLFGITATPSIGIGQQSLLVQTPSGNLLWDPLGTITDDAVNRIRELGGIAWIASSHPHMFGVQLEWSAAFDDAPVYVSARDAGWIQRRGEVIQTWDDRLELGDDLTLHRFGGHFAGSAVAHWTGTSGGVLLASDTIQPTPAPGWVTFMRSYPNRIPLPPAEVERLADLATALPCERLYGNFKDQVIADDALNVVRRSAARQIGWMTGAFDANA